MYRGMDQKTNNTRGTKCQVFSVSVDEAADCSNKEQLPLVLHFVDATNSIREEFAEFVFVIPVHLEVQ